MPALSFPPELLLKAQGRGLGVKAAVFDVDGVLTDGRIYIGETGEVFKAFSTLDGHGLKLLAAAGIVPISTNAVLCEFQRTWARPDAAAWGALYGELVPNYHAVGESYRRAQEAAGPKR